MLANQSNTVSLLQLLAPQVPLFPHPLAPSLFDEPQEQFVHAIRKYILIVDSNPSTTFTLNDSFVKIVFFQLWKMQKRGKLLKTKSPDFQRNQAKKYAVFLV